MEVQCCFKTTLPDRFKVPDDTEISLSTSSTTKELTQIVKQLLLEDNEDQAMVKELASKKLNFMVNNTFLTLTLQELLEQLSLSNESVIDVYYLFALEKPKPKKSIPQDEWISTIGSLTHIINQKAKSYVAGFFNGDVKLFDSKHQELLSVS